MNRMMKGCLLSTPQTTFARSCIALEAATCAICPQAASKDNLNQSWMHPCKILAGFPARRAESAEHTLAAKREDLVQLLLTRNKRGQFKTATITGFILL